MRYPVCGSSRRRAAVHARSGLFALLIHTDISLTAQFTNQAETS